MNDLLLQVENLKTYFYTDEGVVRAVDGIDFEIKRGRTLGVLGESGCGKSITSLSVLRLIQKPGKIVDGSIRYFRDQGGDQSIDLVKLDQNGDAIRDIRGGEIAMVFQEPMTSFDPMYTIGNQIIESIVEHQSLSDKEARKIAVESLHHVGMPQPDYVVDRYPHQLSGGMRQRAMIAMALACNPKLLIADEPTTALDVTTQAQIIELLYKLKMDDGLTMMYITHNLGVIAEVADDVIVMYLGRIVEHCDIESLFASPKHPYTRALINSIPKLGETSRHSRLEAIEGMVPSPYNLPSGCPFHPRCKEAIEGLCNVKNPQTVDTGNGHLVNCFLYDDVPVTDQAVFTESEVHHGSPGT